MCVNLPGEFFPAAPAGINSLLFCLYDSEAESASSRGSSPSDGEDVSPSTDLRSKAECEQYNCMKDEKTMPLHTILGP